MGGLMKPYRDRGTMGLPAELWPIMHPMQNLHGRGVGTYGAMQGGKPTPPWWRYPVTYIVCRFWYSVPMIRQTPESIAATLERMKAYAPLTRRTPTGWEWVDCGCHGDRNAVGEMVITRCEEHPDEERQR